MSRCYRQAWRWSFHLTDRPSPPIWGQAEKRTPHYRLRDVKAAFADPDRLNRTMSAATGAAALWMDEQDVVDVIAGLAADDFDKSMVSHVDRASWQDVYKPVVGGRELYVKVTLDAQGALLLISFEGNEP